MKSNGIPQYWIDRRFDQLQGSDSFLKQVNEIKQWDFADPISIFMISNKNGIGKTHLAMCLYRKYVYKFVEKFGDRIQSGTYNCFVKESHIYRRIQDTYSDKSFEKEKDVIIEYGNKSFLVIDDLFSSRDNEFARRVMLDIIDLRLDWNRKPTVITSNLALDDIAKIDSRIASRLTNGLVIHFGSEKDWRGEKK